MPTLLLSIVLYALSPLALGLVVLSTVLGWNDLKKRYERSGSIGSRVTFAFRVLGLSQLISLVCLIAFLGITSGYGLFVAPLLVFTNMFAAIEIFVVSLYIFSRAEKWAARNSPISTDSHKFSTPLSFYFLSVAGIVIPAILFLGLNGKQIAYELLSQYTLATNSVGLVKYQPYEFQRTELYLAIAKQKQDPRICDNLSFPLYKANCYQDADPEFKTATSDNSSCELYLKQGDAEQADYIQRDCLLNKIYTQEKSTAPSDTLDCDALAKNYGGNRQIDYVVKECRGIALIQKAVTQKNPLICNDILKTAPSTDFDNVPLKHAACIVHFHGSETWRQGCAKYKDNEQFGINYKELASCDSDTVTPPESVAAERFWFQ